MKKFETYELMEVLGEIAYITPTGAKTHQEGNFLPLLEPKLRKVFYETYAEVPEVYSKIFNVKTSSKAVETDYHLGAMKPWTEFGSPITNPLGKTIGASVPQTIDPNSDGSAITGTTTLSEVNYQTIPTGAIVQYAHREFAEGFMVERKFMDDEQYAVIEKMTKDLARAGRSLVETEANAVLNGAFTSSTRFQPAIANHVSYKPLIATNHALLNSGSTVSNQIGVVASGSQTAVVNPELCQRAVQDGLTLGRKQVDEAGKLIQLNFDTIVVPPELEWKAMQIAQSSHQLDTANNNVNLMNGRFKVIVNPFLTSSTAWFMLDSKRHELNFFWRVRPEFKREQDFDTLASKYAGYMRFAVGSSDWRGILGSQGTGAVTVPQA